MRKVSNMLQASNSSLSGLPVTSALSILNHAPALRHCAPDLSGEAIHTLIPQDGLPGRVAPRNDKRISQAALVRTQSQKGSALVEFALILPMFLLLLFGVITFSIALYDKTVLTMATREGARAGAIHDPNSSSSSRAQTAASNVCQNNLITFGDSMTPAITATTSGDILTVSANINYTGLYIFSIALPISAESSMRLE